MPEIRACWFCKYFTYTNADGPYSEETPGNDFSISCNKDKWIFDAWETSQDEFGAILQTAETCPDYEVRK